MAVQWDGGFCGSSLSRWRDLGESGLGPWLRCGGIAYSDLPAKIRVERGADMSELPQSDPGQR